MVVNLKLQFRNVRFRNETHLGGAEPYDFKETEYGKKFIRDLQSKIIENMHNHAGVPFHTYASTQHPSGEMEASLSVNSRGKNSFTIGFHVPYSNILETGRKAETGFFIFRGYYPNRRLLRNFIRSGLPEFTYGKSKRYAQKTANIHADELYDEFVEDKHAGVENVAARLLQEKPGEKGTAILEDKAKYPFGIYTVYANKLKAVPEYHIVKNAATWARPRLRQAVKDSYIQYLNGKKMS